MMGADSLINVRNLGDALGAALHDNAKQGEARMDLRTHPGKGRTAFEIGLPRLRGLASDMGMSAEGIDYIERKARAQYDKAAVMTESPIERAVLGALITGRWSGFGTIPPVIHNASKGSAELLPVGDVVIIPQMAFLKFRLDFGLMIERGGQRRIAAIECDGAEFHRDYEREAFRDAYLNSWDIPVFHLKGSEIHEDPVAAADSVIGAICRWKAE